MDDIETELARKVGEIGGLRHDLRKVTDDLALAKAEADRERGRAEEIAAKLQSGSGTSDSSDTAVKAGLRELEMMLEQSLTQLGQAETERERMRVELGDVQQGLERAKQHITSLQERRDQLREENGKLREKLGLKAED
jgi:chromosome segregation ATPase